MSVFKSMQINHSGLSLERLKMDIISTNMANVNTTRSEDGGPYKKKEVLFMENLVSAVGSMEKKKSEGVKVVGIRDKEEGLREVYDPDHPDSNEEGYVFFPNVNMVDEMISLINVQRTYEANVTALTTSKNILKKALEISKG